MTCDCYVCQLTHKVAAVQERLSTEDRAVIEELLNAWANDSMEAGRNHAFLKGWWPGAKRIGAAPQGKCEHDWPEDSDPPAKWMCKCGTLVYHSYADYCDD